MGRFRQQAEACDQLGSPMYGELLRRFVHEYELGGPGVEVLRGHEDDSGPSALALRLLGSVHRLVLAGEAPELAAFYPSVGGEWDARLGWEAFEQVLASRGPELRVLLDQPPQTNEVGRAAALYGGLLHLGEVYGGRPHLGGSAPLPVRLFEIGSSAGLNLRADRFRYAVSDGSWVGPADSPVSIAHAWTGRALPPAREVAIVERSGSDIAPIDPTSTDGAIALTAYVWPDMDVRLARLRGALQIAREVPAEVRRQDAVSFLRGIELAAGAVTVLWHSIMWQYLTAEDQATGTGLIQALGERATADAPFAHLVLEPIRRTPDTPHEFLVVLQVWPTGERRILGRAAPHGAPVSWE